MFLINPYRFASAPLWTPANRSTEFWLDAADTGTLYDATSGGSLVSTGNAVARWEDKSGNGRHATQSTSGDRPTYTASGLNSKNVVTFSSGKLLTMSSVLASSATSGSVYWVQKVDADPPTSEATSGSSINKDWGSGNQINHLPYLDGIIYFQAFSTARKTMTNPSSSLASARLLGSESASNNYKFWIDGTEFYTTGTNTFSNSSGKKTIGYDSSQYSFLGYIAEMIVVNEIPSLANRELIEGYLAHKWGLTDSLPSGHSYKSSAPTV